MNIANLKRRLSAITTRKVRGPASTSGERRHRLTELVMKAQARVLGLPAPTSEEVASAVHAGALPALVPDLCMRRAEDAERDGRVVEGRYWRERAAFASRTANVIGVQGEVRP